MDMKKFYRLRFKRNLIIFAAFICLISAISLTINVIRMVNSFGSSTYNLSVDITSMILSIAIIGIVVYSFLKSGFYFKDDRLIFVLSLFSVNIPYDNTLLLRHDKKNRLLVLYYNNPTKDKPENIKFAIVSIDDDKTDEFIDTIKDRNSRLIYEIFDKSQEDKEE